MTEESSRELLGGLAEAVAQEFQAIHKRIDGTEEMMAAIMLGVTDLWAGVEQALVTLMGDASPEEMRKFNEETMRRRNELFKSINDLIPQSKEEDPEPQPSDGPEYHEEHRAWEQRQSP